MSATISKKALIDKITNVVEPAGGIRSTSLLAGVTPNHTVADAVQLEEKAIKLGIAEALIDNLAPAPDGLVVRDVFPDLDFEDQNATTISGRNWVQPASGTWAAAAINTSTQVYQTNTDTGNNKKVYVFYGARATNTGPGDESTTIGINSITFKRGSNTKVVDIWQIEEIDTTPSRVVYARTPVLFKIDDNQRIDMTVSAKGSGTADNVMLLGKLIEKAGDTLTG